MFVQNRNVKWKKNSFKIAELIGKSFDSYFEIEGQKLVPLDLKTLTEEQNEDHSSSGEEEKNEEIQENTQKKDNRDIFDRNNAQKLDKNDVKKYKEERGVDILIEKLKENSDTFQKKTAFAQEKYIKKKKIK